MERIRVLGNTIQVTDGPGLEADLARQLDMPEHSPAELAEAVYQLVDESKLRISKSSVSLGKGGISEEPVFEDVTLFSVV